MSMTTQLDAAVVNVWRYVCKFVKQTIH